MRIEIVDPFGQPYRIDSDNPQTIGAWFAEIAETVASANMALQARLMCIIPSMSQDIYGKLYDYKEPRQWDQLVSIEKLREMGALFDKWASEKTV